MPLIASLATLLAPHAGHLSGFQPAVTVAAQWHELHSSNLGSSFFGDCICADNGDPRAVWPALKALHLSN